MTLHSPSAGRTAALPAARLFEIHDCLTLALDATESRAGYPQHLREARSYLRAALPQVDKLTGDAQ